MMDMPLGALGVLAATSLRLMPNDVYFQIGLITIIGLSAKNAILVVEFAKERFDTGATLIDAALHAVRQRLRPILMTSLAFGFGVLPLALSHGAGSGSQNAIGTGIVGRRTHHHGSRPLLRPALFCDGAASLPGEANEPAGEIRPALRSHARQWGLEGGQIARGKSGVDSSVTTRH